MWVRTTQGILFIEVESTAQKLYLTKQNKNNITWN